jgi:tetratricopeptide (TPR) repeat protein
MNRKERRAAKSQGKADPGRPATAGSAGSSGQITERLAQALAHHQAGRLVEAEALYRQIQAVAPRHVDSLYLLGVLLGQRGRTDLAIDTMGQVLTLKPDFAQAHNDLGVLLLAQSKPAEAMACFERALALKPDSAEANYNQGIALARMSRLDDAAERYERAVALKPGYHEAHYNLGNIRKRQGRLVDASMLYRRVLALKPDYADAHNALGAVLLLQDEPRQAMACFERALALKPDDVETLNNRGSALRNLERLSEALASYDHALALKPDHVEALNNRGNALQGLNRIGEALTSFDKAIEIRPDYDEAHLNRSCLRLLAGDLEPGWEEYEWRWRTSATAPWRRDFVQPLWLGEQPLEGRTILLHDEQGFGDAIQFVRYLPLVAARAAKVILEVQPPLKALLSGVEGASLVLGRGEELPEFDYRCPLVSLPLAFKTRLDTIPATVPYLSASEDRVIKWKQRLPASRTRRIGIAWAGNPAFNGDRSRSIGLPRFSPLLSVAGVEFYSIQRELREGDRDILNSHPHVVHLGDTITDFDDTAAIISLLDLVISSDTSVVHLAGAMGRPLWILLQYVADWRWLLDRGDSPWYPTARLFRQPEMGDWESVVARVGQELMSPGPGH